MRLVGLFSWIEKIGGLKVFFFYCGCFVFILYVYRVVKNFSNSWCLNLNFVVYIILEKINVFIN